MAGSFYQSSAFGTETIENKVTQRGLLAGVPAEPSSSVPHVSNEQSEHTKTQSDFKKNKDDDTDVSKLPIPAPDQYHNSFLPIVL